MRNQQNTIVRRSVRHDVSIRASARVMPEHSSAIRLAGGAGARDGWVDVDIIDFSSSGVGIMSPVFFPRRTLISVRLYGPQPGDPVIVEAPLRVQRVVMSDRRPMYLIGTSFADPPPGSVAQINKLLELLDGPGEARGS